MIQLIFIITTALLLIVAMVKNEKSILKELISIWLGVAGLACLAYCYVELAG